jgi:hypothetical protein
MSARKPTQLSLPFNRDTLTPRRHPLRSKTDLRRDQRVIADRIRDRYLRKYGRAA